MERNAPTCVGHVLTIAPSTKDTLWFDLISSRDLGLGNERKSFVEYMYRPLRVDNFFICPRSFINSSDSIERKVLEAFLDLIRRLPLLYFKIWTTQTMYEIMFSPVFVWGVFQSFALPFRTWSNP